MSELRRIEVPRETVFRSATVEAHLVAYVWHRQLCYHVSDSGLCIENRLENLQWYSVGFKKWHLVRQPPGIHVTVANCRVYPVHVYSVLVYVINRAFLMSLNVPNGIKGVEGLAICTDVVGGRSCASLEVDPNENVVDEVDAAPRAVCVAFAVINVIVAVRSELVAHLNRNAIKTGAGDEAAIDPTAEALILIVGLGPSMALRQNVSSFQSGNACANAKALLVGKLVLLIQFA